jgi:superfamily II DNA or RNA helicase
MHAFTNLEFHRTGIGLVPEGAGETHTAIYVAVVPGSGSALRSCTCAAARTKTCDHLKELSRAVAAVEKAFAARSWEAGFEASVWCRLARLLFEGSPQASAKVRVLRVPREPAPAIRVTAPNGDELAEYLDVSPARVRFLERTGKAAPGGDGIFDRAGLLERLALFQGTEQERVFHKAGMKTRRQTWEESFWHRLAYHCVREFAGRGTFHPAIDETSGRFTFTYRLSEDDPVVRFAVPRDRVRAALQLLAAEYPEQADLAIRPVPLASIFRVTQETELDLEVRPVIRALQENGEERFFEHRDFARFRYGNLIYIKELGVLAELEREGKERKFKAPVSMKLQRGQVASFLAENQDALGAGLLVLDEPLRDRRIFKEFDRIDLSAVDVEEALARSWYWLAIEYGFGSHGVSLAEILRARKEGLPYLETAGGWIDLNAPAFRELDRLGHLGDADGDRFRLPPSELLRLQAAAGRPVRITGDGDAEASARLGGLLELRPAAPFVDSPGLATPPRAYQKIGVDWLLFLVQNRLGGLLCDDMGLGKTLQVLALMVVLLERGEAPEPFLVACPTSVLSHWRNQVQRHAPALRPVVHHGTQRRLPERLGAGDVLLTSYGVLRRDAETLSALPFTLAVFDEAQNLKNRGTQSWQAADHLVADVKLGLTGTPIENALGELKALFDLVLPGYLGTDAGFEQRYEREIQRGDDRLGELRRVISPFVLRRLKSAVLDELPEKIEDVRTCVLSDDQVRLYRDAVDGRGAELAREIEAAADGHLPYLHVFALLSLLKKICDHPALATGDLDRAGELASGKWELYREILAECLESGHKVVVFTQFLGMIELMSRHLEGLGVGFVKLTGASLRRGEIVDRFNQDADCRVFLGSLKAGGTGIDLVGGSAVIHYDRWWNAAKEDQATDRVYRLGQRRAVQVFKLVTEGTLEEKIAALIEKKRQMMASVVQADSPELAKILTRDELLDMLRSSV